MLLGVVAGALLLSEGGPVSIMTGCQGIGARGSDLRAASLAAFLFLAASRFAAIRKWGVRAAPAGWVWVLVGFVAFRFFDIIKPWPINWIDKKVTGGFGIMLDDVIAGAMAALVLQGLAWWF